MSAADYVLGFVAIIVGIAVAAIAESLHRLFRARKRVRWHWFPFAAVLLLLILTLELWSNLSAFAQLGDTLTIAVFLPFVLGLILLHLAASASLPDEVPTDGINLRTYYLESRGYLWSAFAGLLGFFVLFRIIWGWWSGGTVKVVAILPQVVPNLLIVIIMISLARIARPWWHAAWLIILPLAFFNSAANRSFGSAPVQPSQAATSPMPSSPSLR